MIQDAIRTEDLGRTYTLRRHERRQGAADRVALAGVNLTVAPGELFGLLGPNGAGKTTLIKILTTLLAPTTGRAWVDGLDVLTQAEELRPRINMVSGGESCGYGLLTVRETLWLFAQLYGVPTVVARKRMDELLAVVGMPDRADTKVSQLSTGLRQKMNFCRGFLTDPKVLFLDEPTLGLDVNAARGIRQFVRGWVQKRPGRTLLLTTHYMQEADQLCDRLAIIDGGKVLACATPAALKRRVQEHVLFTITVAPGGDPVEGLRRLPGVAHVTAEPSPTAVTLKVALAEEPVVGAVVQALLAGGSHVLTLRKEEPTLEDVFVELVGHGLADEKGA
jgi:ABC-2 type transport system ATP-binding protein